MTDGVVDDLLQTWRSITTVLTLLRPEQWEVQTELPGWTVRDLVSHMAAIEAFLLQRPEPEHEAPDADHVRNPLGAWNEQRVDRRRSWAIADVLSEFQEVTRERESVMRALTDEERAAVVFTPMGDMPLERFLHVRLLDSWLHEQEIRRAVGQAETLDTASAERVLDMVLDWLPRAVAKAGLPDGGGAVIEVTGTVQRRAAAEVRDGRGVAVEQPASVHIEIRGGAGPFLRTATGRLDPHEAIRTGGLSVSGEQATAARVLGLLNRVP